MDDFDIYESWEADQFSELWRIFYQEYDGNPDHLPADTSLQRAYINWFKAGNKAGSGNGLFFYPDTKKTG